ncbi:MAG: CCA tRNA nucleotidyltransferase [Longimicrobiales bacterium]
MHLAPPPAVVDVARTLEQAGFQAWAVGGAVRDALLGKSAQDWDIATSARPEQVRGLFRRTVPIGIDHGTVGVLAGDVLYEVTTFRRDVETFGRHAVVEFADSVEEDLARRDFTFNAIAWNPLTDELLDPFGGLDDLRGGRLRTVGAPADRFAEDHLRVLRALRFAGHFQLAIDAPTWIALVAAVPLLSTLSAERVREELTKVLTKTRRASASLSLYATAGALSPLYPELEATVGVDAGADHELDVWTESLLAIDTLAPTRPRLRLAALFHGLGIPGSRVRDLRGGWRATGHAAVGAALTEALMRRLRFSNADTSTVVELLRMQEQLFPPDSDGARVRRWLHAIGPVDPRDLFRLRIALCRANPRAGASGAADLSERWHLAHHVLMQRPPLRVTDLAIGGDDLKSLGLRPGPEYRDLLAALLDRVLDDPTLNTRDALLGLIRAQLERLDPGA